MLPPQATTQLPTIARLRPPRSRRAWLAPITLAAVGWLGCGADLGESQQSEEANLHAASLTWGSPFASPTWRVGFDLYNSALSWSRSSCFGTTMDKIKHAGEDWGGSTSTAVSAIGDGHVIFAALVPYPGHVVVIRHDLSDAQRRALGLAVPVLYSQYGHLTALTVKAGDAVRAGQKLGTLHDQAANTHLHWEVRTAEKPPLCGTTPWGPGYTGPGTTATSYGYLNPSASLRLLQGAGTSSCTSGDGLYCGGNGVVGAAATLYRCTAGALAVAQVCSYGCEHMPAGTSDRCAAAPGSCSVTNGLYCGGNGVVGATNILYRCSDRVLKYVETCAKGCERRPTGTPDRCR
jgi:hypothetical protein